MKPKHPRFTKHQKWLKQNMSIFNEIFNSCWTRMMRILSLRHMVTGQRPNTLSSLKLSHCQMVGIEPCRRIHERFISFMWKETSEPMTSKSASPPEFASPKKNRDPRERDRNDCGKFLGPRGLREMWVVFL